MDQLYKLIWISTLLLLGLCFLGVNKLIDIQLYDSYFVISIFHLGLVCSGYLALTGFIYWLVRNKRLLSWMTVSHIFITILTFFMLVILSLKLRVVNEKILLLLVMFFVSGQLVFIFNVIFGLFRDRPNQH